MGYVLCVMCNAYTQTRQTKPKESDSGAPYGVRSPYGVRFPFGGFTAPLWHSVGVRGSSQSRSQSRSQSALVATAARRQSVGRSVGRSVLLWQGGGVP